MPVAHTCTWCPQFQVGEKLRKSHPIDCIAGLKSRIRVGLDYLYIRQVPPVWIPEFCVAAEGL